PHLSCFCLLRPRLRCGDVRPGEPHKADPNESLRHPPGRPRHTKTGCGANGRSGCDEPGFAKRSLCSGQKGTRGETSDTLCAPEYGADKPPVRIRDLWPEVRPSTAQESLAPSPDHAGATADI